MSDLEMTNNTDDNSIFEEHVPLSKEDAFVFLFKNENLQKFVRQHKMIFIDGYFVVANKQCVELGKNREIHLTEWARNNLPACTINICKINRNNICRKVMFSHNDFSSSENEIENSTDNDEEKNKSKSSKTVLFPFVAAYAGPFSFLLPNLGTLIAAGNIAGSAVSSFKGREKSKPANRQTKEQSEKLLADYAQAPSEIDRRILILNDEYATILTDSLELEAAKGRKSRLSNITSNEIYNSALNFLFEEEYSMEKQFDKILGDPGQTLSNCLQFMMKVKGWNNAETFWDNTLLHRNYFFKIKNDQFNSVKKETLMAVCVGLGLTVRMVEKVFNRAGFKLLDHVDPDRAYIMILEFFPKISINDFNNLLIRVGLKPLGTPDKE